MNTIIKLPTRGPRPKGRGPIEPANTGVRTSGVYVIFTSADATLAAARAAHDLATAMGAPMTIVHFRPVPYALPLTARTRVPNAETDALAAELRKEGISADVCVYLCRSEREAALMTLKPRSLVVVGSDRAWWPLGRAARWSRVLGAAGHLVVSVNPAHFGPLNCRTPLNYQITRSPNHQMKGCARA